MLNLVSRVIALFVVLVMLPSLLSFGVGVEELVVELLLFAGGSWVLLQHHRRRSSLPTP